MDSDFYGLTEDEIIRRIEDGNSLASIARSADVNRSMLTRWLAADEQRSARSARAREASASSYDEQAEDEIRRAADPFELARAKELAQHLRWRSSKIAPKSYGDKLELAGDKESPLTIVVKKLTDA